MYIFPFAPPKFVIQMAAPAAKLIVRSPTVTDFFRCVSADEPAKLAKEILYYYGGDEARYPFTEVTGADFLRSYTQALIQYKEDNMDIMKVPAVISFGAEKKPPFPIVSSGRDLIYHYSGINFREQCELDITEFWMLLADAVKSECEKTEKGREYLENAYNDMHRINTLEATMK